MREKIWSALVETYSLVSVMLVNGANVWIPVTHGGEEVLELCRDDNLFDDNTDG